MIMRVKENGTPSTKREGCCTINPTRKNSSSPEKSGRLCEKSLCNCAPTTNVVRMVARNSSPCSQYFGRDSMKPPVWRTKRIDTGDVSGDCASRSVLEAKDWDMKRKKFLCQTAL